MCIQWHQVMCIEVVQKKINTYEWDRCKDDLAFDRSLEGLVYCSIALFVDQNSDQL